MDDIRRPDATPPQQPTVPTPQPENPAINPPVNPPTVYAASPEPSRLLEIKPRRKKTWLWVVLSLIVVVIGAILTAWLWYQSQLGPVDAAATERTLVTVESGATPEEIATLLKNENLIKSTKVFAIYTRITGTQNVLQAGSYHLSASETLPQIVDHLTSGTVDTFNITFLPGATLQQNRQVLLDAGYSSADVDAALSMQYDSVLFQGKPASADLEGYIYGETYNVGRDEAVADILKKTFAEFESVITENDLVNSYASRGLSLYQGITLASIIQRESVGGDEPQIAQVFYTRLAMNMVLGSDVTYQYIADKTGVARDTELDSPYNTRRFTGLPPGPIATPGLASLLAVANPANGDYVYFLSGDDDVTYFARTLEEHESNILNHCQQKCQIL